MADTTVKIGDVSAQLTKAARLVVNTDSFWVQTGGDSAGNGQSALIPAEYVKAYLAAAVTPQFRAGENGAEASYDGGNTWVQIISYTDLKSVKMVALTQDEYDALVSSGKVDAETYYNILEEE